MKRAIKQSVQTDAQFNEFDEINHEIYNALAAVAFDHRDATKEELQEYFQQGVDWFMDKFFDSDDFE